MHHSLWAFNASSILFSCLLFFAIFPCGHIWRSGLLGNSQIQREPFSTAAADSGHPVNGFAAWQPEAKTSGLRQQILWHLKRRSNGDSRDVSFLCFPLLMEPQLLVVAPQAYHCLAQMKSCSIWKNISSVSMVVSLSRNLGFHFWPSLFGQDCQCVGVSDRIHSVRNKKLSISCLKDHIDWNRFDLLTLFLWARNKQTNRNLHQVLDSKHYIKPCCFGLSTALGATARVPWALWRTRATHTRRHHSRHGFGWENKPNNWIPGLKDESMSDCFQEKTNASTFKSLRALSSHGEISRKWYRWLGPTVTWDSQWIPWGVPVLRSLRVASFRVSGY